MLSPKAPRSLTGAAESGNVFRTGQKKQKMKEGSRVFYHKVVRILSGSVSQKSRPNPQQNYLRAP
jgi:hypothetical protein